MIESSDDDVEPYVSEEDIEDVTNEYSDDEITKKKKKKKLPKTNTNYDTSSTDASDVEQEHGAVEDGEVMDQGELCAEETEEYHGAEDAEEYHGAEDAEERSSTGDREQITGVGAYREADDPLSD